MLSEEQLALRKTGVGSSDISAIVGLSPWATDVDIYNQKLDLVPPPAGRAMTAGQNLEDAVASWAAKEQGWRLRRYNRTLRHAREPWVLATPDRDILRDRRRVALAEVKTAGSGTEWGVEGTDQIPDHYRVQCQWQLTVVRSRPEQKHVQTVFVPAFFFTSRELKIYAVEHNEGLEDVLLDAGHRFWHNCVLAGEPPELDPASRSGTHDYLAAVLDQLTNKVMQAPLEAKKWADQLQRARTAIAAATEEADQASAYLKAYIGNDRGLKGPWGRALWSMSKSSGPDWKRIAQEMFAMLQLGGIADASTCAELVERKQRPGSRRFRFTPDKEYFGGAS